MIQKRFRANLERLADGWRPLRDQLMHGRYYLDRGYARLDWGPAGTPDEDKMCWYITDQGRAALAEAKQRDRT